MVIKSFDQLPKESLPFNRVLVLKAGIDLTDTVNAEAMEFRATIPAFYRLDDLVLTVPVAPRNSADAAFNDLQITLGDSSGATLFLTATQIAALAGSPISFAAIKRPGGVSQTSATVSAAAAATQSGSYVQADVQTIATLANALKTAVNALVVDVGAVLAAAPKGKLYSVADYLKVVVTPMSGKNLAALDVGEIRVYAAFTMRDHIG